VRHHHGNGDKATTITRSHTSAIDQMALNPMRVGPATALRPDVVPARRRRRDWLVRCGAISAYPNVNE
jgi:hypothetical protein